MECRCNRCLLVDECTPNKISEYRKKHCEDFEDAGIVVNCTFFNGEVYWEEMSYRKYSCEREYEPTEWELFVEE